MCNFIDILGGVRTLLRPYISFIAASRGRKLHKVVLINSITQKVNFMTLSRKRNKFESDRKEFVIKYRIDNEVLKVKNILDIMKHILIKRL